MKEAIYGKFAIAMALIALLAFAACGDDGDGNGGDDDDAPTATVAIKNDFNNPEMERKPPWTICDAYYGGQKFGKIPIGETSEKKEVKAGLDFVYMVAAWDDPDCNPKNCLPIASKNEEETVEGQERVIAINMPNHQGPCPPEGIQPIPEENYNKILELWPEYNFKPYAEREQNTECLGEE